MQNTKHKTKQNRGYRRHAHAQKKVIHLVQLSLGHSDPRCTAEKGPRMSIPPGPSKK
jgi:hypothetical protein